MSTVTRFRRNRRRRDTVPPRRVITIAGIATAVIVGLVWLALSIYGGAPWNSYKTVYLNAPDTGNLRSHDPVKVAGVEVGQVHSISVTQTGDARLDLKINAKTKVLKGTTFAIRANGLLGSRYVQLIPGHGPGVLPADSTVTVGSDALTYGVPEALNVFNAQTRGGLGKMITGLGEGLLGRGSGVNTTIHLISTESQPVQVLVKALLNANLQGLVPSLDSLTAPLDAARDQIGQMLEPAAKALEPFVSQRPAVQQTLDQAPSALAAASSGLGQGDRLLDAANELATQAQQILPLAPSGLHQTTLLLADSHPALDETHTLLVDAKPAVPDLLKLTNSVSPVLDPLSRVLSRATPIANQVAPYGCNVANTAAVLRSMTGFGGQGTGPDGPAMAFRLEIVLAPPTEILGTKDYTGLVHRVGYAAPCTYLGTTYPTVTQPLSGLTGTDGQ
jgi:virulence factor Mce-like protein